MGDEFRIRIGGKGWMYLHDMGSAKHTCHWSDITKVIEAKSRVERSIDCIRRTIEEQRVSVGRRPHNDFGAEITPSPAVIFDDDWLPQPLR